MNKEVIKLAKYIEESAVPSSVYNPSPRTLKDYRLIINSGICDESNMILILYDIWVKSLTKKDKLTLLETIRGMYLSGNKPLGISGTLPAAEFRLHKVESWINIGFSLSEVIPEFDSKYMYPPREWNGRTPDDYRKEVEWELNRLIALYTDSVYYESIGIPYNEILDEFINEIS